MQELALLKKRKRDDLDKKRKLDNAARIKMAAVRKKKQDEKLAIAGGRKVLMPEVYVSNYLKQQRNFVKYKRQKTSHSPRFNEAAAAVEDKQELVLPKAQRVPPNCLLLVIRIKESRNATPQAQKILRELGLKEINNCAFVRASTQEMERLLLIQNYVAWGRPTKTILDEVVRKRGYLKKESKRVPISDNVVVEELLGSAGIICIEDIVDALWRCKSNVEGYTAVRNILWPIQLAPLKEPSDKANTTHDATGRELKKKTTKVHKGGYLGNMGDQINEFVA